MKNTKVDAGSILIAQPFMMDGNFRRSVVLLCEHRPDGSVGFILNKKIDMKVAELVADFPDEDFEVYFGGPVATDTIHYIHNVGDLLEDSTEITRGVYWGGDFTKLKFLIANKVILPKNIKFFVGYSGWSDGQLAEELQYGSWITEEMDANYAFKTTDDQLWSKVLDVKGDTFSVIAKIPEKFSLN